MADIDCDWHGDLSLTPTGDLLLAVGDDMVRQHIERRLFTRVRGYIWHLEYGAGLPEHIGRTARVADIQALVRAHIALETTVAPTPIPVIRVDQPIAGGFVIFIGYTDAATGTAVNLNFEVPAN